MSKVADAAAAAAAMKFDPAFLVTIGVLITAVWAGLRFVFEPRMRVAIDERITEKTKDICGDLDALRADVERNKEQLLIVPHTLQSLDRGIQELTTAVRTLTQQTHEQGKEQAEMRGEMRGAIDRIERRREERRQHYTDPAGLPHEERRRAERRADAEDDPR